MKEKERKGINCKLLIAGRRRASMGFSCFDAVGNHHEKKIFIDTDSFFSPLWVTLIIKFLVYCCVVCVFWCFLSTGMWVDSILCPCRFYKLIGIFVHTGTEEWSCCLVECEWKVGSLYFDHLFFGHTRTKWNFTLCTIYRGCFQPSNPISIYDVQ